MIKNQWYVALSSNELRDKPLGLTRFSEKLVFWRGKNNEVCCIKDKCIHRGASLCMGKVVDGEIECPFHVFRYDNTGKCTVIPANGKNSNIPTNFKASSYKTKEAHGFIWVFYGDEESIDEELPFFSELDNFSYHEFKNHWNSGYSRVIENQLDVVHVPFVHKSTIGRGNKTLVNGPLVQVNKDEITIKVFNSIDDGNLPKDEEILKETDKEQKLIFKFPNLWQNYINKDIRVLIAFSPIDDENTMLYLRFYQRLIKAPIFRSLFNLSGSLANYIIMNQDKKIVEEQIPKMSELKMAEKLIKGDKPIVVYRKMRNELINKK